jgi:hypothetical protein
VPQFAHVRLAETALHEIVPVEHHADAVVLLIDDTPAMGVVVEAQLQPDDRKRFTWPLYAIAARARHLCPCIVLVLTADEATARWAAKPIDLGGGSYYRVHVIGPDGIPVVTEIERAMAVPELVLLSVMAHGRDDPSQALQIAVAAVAAIEPLPEDRRVVYFRLVETSLSEAARKAFEMLPQTQRLMSESERRGFEQGEAKGKAEG